MNNVLAHAAATPPAQSTKEIPLTKGKAAIVDAADYEWLMQWKWCARTTRKRWYASRRTRASENNPSERIWMHRLILNAPQGIEVDHRDGNGLNNSRRNLRAASHAQNQCNRRQQCNNTSGYKGVSWHRRDRVWRSSIRVNGKQVHLGSFRDKEVAAHRYDEAARLYHGNFARLNFPDG